MADYQLSYSGEEVDEVCKKVKDMSFTAEQINHFFNMKNKLQMRWGRRSERYTLTNHHTTHIGCRITGIFPKGLEDDDKEAFIFVGCDYGGQPFDMACTSYKKEGRDVVVEGLVRPGDCNPGVENNPGKYDFTFYCLVIFTETRDQGIE